MTGRSRAFMPVVGALILLLLINGLLLSNVSLLIRGIGALMLICGLRGFLIGAILFPDWIRSLPRIGLGLLEWIGLTAGLGYGTVIVITLLLSYLPDGMPFWMTLAAFDLVVLLLTGIVWWTTTGPKSPKIEEQQSEITQGAHTDWHGVTFYLPILGLLILLLVGGYLRLANIGYSEFQGDEARAVLRAAAVIQGYEDVLFIHRKGPTEILLPAALYSLLGQMDELVARVPFAMANLFGLVALWAVGWRFFTAAAWWGKEEQNPRQESVRTGALIGWWAAMLLAVDGYFIGFARIVQYQSVVFLLSVLVVWLLIRTLDERKWANRTLPTAAFLLGAGLLSHYEAGLVALPGLFFLWLWMKNQSGLDSIEARDDSRRGLNWSRLSGVLMAVGVLLAVAAIFYVPFVLNPIFADTLRYLTESRVGVGGQFPYNNLGDFWTRTTLYSTSVYVVLLGLFGIAGLVRLGMWAVSVSKMPKDKASDSVHTIAISETDISRLLMIATWWLGPFVLAMFFTADPRTHVYTSFFGWTLLAAWAIVCFGSFIAQRLIGWMGRPTLMVAGTLVSLIIFGYFGNYAYWYFVHTDDEILRHWDTKRPSGYPVTYEEPTEQGIFGFPMKNGWNAVKGLYADGLLDGSYLTNTKPHVVNWYLRNVDLCTRNHRYYFLVEDNNLYKRAEVDALREMLAQNYVHWGTVLVEGHQRLEIHDNQLSPDDVADHWPILFPVAHFEAELTAARFSDPYFGITEPYVSPQVSPIVQETTDLQLTDSTNGNVIRLLGYSVDKRTVAPNKSVFVTLYWQAAQDMTQDYTVFNQIVDLAANRKMGQLDAQPGCDGRPTSIWATGEVVVDRHRVPIFEDAVTGEYPLIMGLYDPQTGSRLEVIDASGSIIGDYADLGTIRVQAQE